jgi:muramoyltetrapeptide carboxypeptidase LdcA involved in peptidoglycan recycling
MTAAVQQQAGAGGQAASSVAAPNEAPNEVLQRAFQQGVDYATQQLAQQQAALDASSRQQRLGDLQHTNEDQERELRERTEALRRREYRC